MYSYTPPPPPPPFPTTAPPSEAFPPGLQHAAGVCSETPGPGPQPPSDGKAIQLLWKPPPSTPADGQKRKLEICFFFFFFSLSLSLSLLSLLKPSPKRKHGLVQHILTWVIRTIFLSSNSNKFCLSFLCSCSVFLRQDQRPIMRKTIHTSLY